MVAVRKKTVWVLGAGFSRSLGGPLLTDLLSPKSRNESREAFERGEAGNLVYSIFWKHQKPGLRHHTHVPQGEGYWEHAEDFLDFLDAAARNPLGTRGKLLGKLLKRMSPSQKYFVEQDALKSLHEEAKKIIAAECLFTETFDPQAEGSEPYVTWAQFLPREDRIISFNYDLVLEKLGEGAISPLGTSSVMLPNGRFDEPGIQVYKLHGSVDWFYDPQAAEVRRANDAKDLLSGDKAPLIATPGPTKRHHSKDYFDFLWAAAKYSLKHAERIVFLGYRFPPSDAQARIELLGAIRNNQVTELEIHTVVRGNPADTDRLGQLLKFCLHGTDRFNVEQYAHPPGKSYRLIQHSLFVEDFLSFYPGYIGLRTEYD
jgi:hypothetical protein